MKDQEQKQDPVRNDNLRFWKSWEHVAPGMLKEIKGGNLNGKSDINPVWRFKALTDAFGPCGIGWKVKEVERWKDEAAGEISVNVKVHLFIKYDNGITSEWSEPIEGVGGSKLCGKGRGDGLNDEAWKMATTDAISVACKALGMAADVYTGRQSHKDPDQKKTGGDYGSKYEARNYGQNSTRNSQTGNYTTQPQRGQNSPIPGVATGTQAPAPAPAPAQKRVTVTQAILDSGKAHNLVTALSRHDYDDMRDWAAGLDELRQKYDFAPGIMEQVEQLAVEERNARLAPPAPASAPADDLPL